MYSFLRPLIFKLQPEQAHELTVSMLRLAGSVPLADKLMGCFFTPKENGPAVDAFGLHFSNPVGLAAGYDKDGLARRGLAALGFGHLELGTVTPIAQYGNPKPRLTRIVDQRAVINRMGFNNRGMDFMAKQLRNRRPGGPVIGVNIGKNKQTPNEEAVNDYLMLIKVFASLADYLVVNVSSPNTPGLRSLQNYQALLDLLTPISQEKNNQAEINGRKTPILVKLAPDLSLGELEQALDAIQSSGIDGVIISNTTMTRPGIPAKIAAEAGGLSGAPLSALSLRMVRETAHLTKGRLPIIASGGIFSGADAQARLDAGASLVQIYTGMIYEGPALVKNILDYGLVNKVKSTAAFSQDPSWRKNPPRETFNPAPGYLVNEEHHSVNWG